MKAISQKSFYKEVFNTLVEEYSCWADYSIEKLDEYVIQIKSWTGDYYSRAIEKALNVSRYYDNVVENATIYAMIDAEYGFVVRVKVSK